MKRQIPNLITLGNLFCGVMATYNAAFGRFEYAVIFILLGIFFDFFDGMAARLLNVASPLGKELDSLADLITSGIAPGFILFSILWNHNSSILIKYIAFLIPVFAAYRLAKFNLDERQTHSFIGLPAPANALLWAGIGLWFCSYNDAFVTLPSWHNQTLWDPFFSFLFSDAGLLVLCILTLITDYLLISEIPLFSLKLNFKDLSWKSNWIQYCFLLGCLILVICFGFIALPIIILWYLIWSLCTLKKGKNHD